MVEIENLDDIVRRLCTVEAPLNERLRQFSAALKSREPHYATAYDALAERLTAARAGGSAPDVGDVLPPFALPDANSGIHRLDDMLARGPVVVSFNRGHWCPYCKVELSALKQGLKRIGEAGAQVVSIMPDAPDYVAKVADEVGNAFLVLSDKDNGYALSLDLVIWLGAHIEDLFRADKFSLQEVQHNGAGFVPIPATFVVGADGRIVARFIDPDFRKRMEIDDIIEALKRAWT